MSDYRIYCDMDAMDIMDCLSDSQEVDFMYECFKYLSFDEERDATDEMPDMSRIAITQDVSIVKRDRVNYTEEEKLRMARKYGLTTKDLQEIEDEELLSGGKKEEAPDYFEYLEEKEDTIRHGNNGTMSYEPTEDAEQL